MTSFVKLFTTLTDSSVWALPDHVRVIWITLLSMANSRGNIHASVIGVAGRARKTVAEVEEALAIFRAPDPYSRTREHEGRRIIDIDGGWHLVNYGKHRAALTAEAVRETKRAYAERRRARERESGDSAAEVDISRKASIVCSVSRSDLSGSGSGSDPDPDRARAQEPAHLAREPGTDAHAVSFTGAASYVAPEDFAPDERHVARCEELRLDVEQLAAEFRAYEFARPYRDWPRRFAAWIEDARKRRETERGRRPRRRTDAPNQPNCGMTGLEIFDREHGGRQ